MTLKEYIDALTAIYEEHGDLQVETSKFSGREPARMPRLSHQKILSGRQRRPEFWNEWNGESTKGEMVVQV